ncbi:hypothetical protein [Desertivirga arenae]|uniref:hypothetical protein n=1 Tax=Desertivirga arenae TaxID=2810309 RepID=UPI001A965A46|nr:hypothetical protein [Pedobacter sp. SYSU D00823]
MENVRNNYLVLTYANLPDSQFLCDFRGTIRVKISRIREKINTLSAGTIICGITDDCILLFEDVGCKSITWKDIEGALAWYKRFSKIEKLEVYIPDEIKN